MRPMKVWMAGGLGAGLVACADDAGRAPAAPEPTFWQDVAPILEAKCTACHQAGGIAPFPLDDIDDVEQRATLIADLTESRIMPPYLMEVGSECGSFDEHEALTSAEIATIAAWARGERLVGEPGSISPPEVPSLTDGTDLFTPNFTPQIEGGTLAEFDEYRCFALDLGSSEDSFVTGFEVTPGNSAIVHHAVVMLLDPAAPSYLEGLSNQQAIARLHEQDPNPEREGWRCFSEAGEGVRVESVPSVWAPGMAPYTFPDGVGVPVHPNRQLVIQLHFNLADPDVRGQSDQTRVRLQLRKQVERQAAFLLRDAFLGSAFDATPDVLEPGNPAARYTWTETGRAMGIPPGVSVQVLSVVPHMHQRGRKYRLEFGRDDAFECQGRIDRWDFNWQRIYSYAPAPTLDADSQVRVSCEYDTRADTVPVQPGWGTRNEMCEVTLGLVLPPGVSL